MKVAKTARLEGRFESQGPELEKLKAEIEKLRAEIDRLAGINERLSLAIG